MSNAIKDYDAGCGRSRDGRLGRWMWRSFFVEQCWTRIFRSFTYSSQIFDDPPFGPS